MTSKCKARICLFKRRDDSEFLCFVDQVGEIVTHELRQGFIHHRDSDMRSQRIAELSFLIEKQDSRIRHSTEDGIAAGSLNSWTRNGGTRPSMPEFYAESLLVRYLDSP
jgi:hypothetical protein